MCERDVHLSQVVVGGGDESTRSLADVNSAALGRWWGKLIRHKDLIHLAPRFRPHLYLKIPQSGCYRRQRRFEQEWQIEPRVKWGE